MDGKFFKISLVVLLINLSFARMTAQISPGDLAGPHSHLEGLSNCTQCHVLGNKVTNEKCLNCHTEVQQRMTSGKGYHTSAEVTGKQCITCHNDHHGKNFQLIRFDTTKFDHNLTGYNLSVPHSRKKCIDCHAPKFITDQKFKTKKYTWMGVSRECLNCHADYHMKTLSSVCTDCHNQEVFKPATNFNHDRLKFKLLGKHKEVECFKCHKVEVKEGRKFQEFSGVKYGSCTNCHKDPHQNRFGQICNQCHSEETFKVVKGINKFDHNLTHYKLEEKHLTVNCKACHKTNFTDPLKFGKCTDCHVDYHKKQFVRNNVTPDCSPCHTVLGFTYFSYSIDQHNTGNFPLRGAHVAIPCIDCHKKQKEWNFKGIGITCIDCHTDIHKPFIDTKYYPGANCTVCHNDNGWKSVTFDHSKTNFALTGAHLKQNCRVCHIQMDSAGIVLRDPKGIIKQKFTGFSKGCTECHTDNHFRQFAKNGVTTCIDCHQTDNWKATKFNHNDAAFKLDGKHINVACVKCHKPQQQGTLFYVKYKLKDFRCETCH
jgi:hypothetical protein